MFALLILSCTESNFFAFYGPRCFIWVSSRETFISWCMNLSDHDSPHRNQSLAS